MTDAYDARFATDPTSRRAAPPPVEGYARYAIYYAPAPETPLSRFGEGWLGRTAEGEDRPFVAPRSLPERQSALTADARRYGLHATLKAPFALAPGVSAAQLDAAMTAFAAERPALFAPRLRLSSAHGFVSLRPSAPSPALDAMAAGVVAHFARFAARPSAATLAKRRAAGLTARQEAYLTAYGYPWVFEDFFFHITLTRRISRDAADQVRSVLTQPLQPVLNGPGLHIDALCLFGDPGGGAPFRLLRRRPFAPLRRRDDAANDIGPSASGSTSAEHEARPDAPAA
ncbi:MAG: DUF1045 domain-containing protein [Pseudomonadota bacterium]